MIAQAGRDKELKDTLHTCAAASALPYSLRSDRATTTGFGWSDGITARRCNFAGQDKILSRNYSTHTCLNPGQLALWHYSSSASQAQLDHDRKQTVKSNATMRFVPADRSRLISSASKTPSLKSRGAKQESDTAALSIPTALVSGWILARTPLRRGSFEGSRT